MLVNNYNSLIFSNILVQSVKCRLLILECGVCSVQHATYIDWLAVYSLHCAKISRLLVPSVGLWNRSSLMVAALLSWCPKQQGVQGKVVYCIVLQCSAVQYNTVQYSASHCSTVQYSTVQYNTVQYSTIQCFTGVHFTTVQCRLLCGQSVSWAFDCFLPQSSFDIETSNISLLCWKHKH